MPFGKYCREEKNMPAGYAGVFLGTLYNKNGKVIYSAGDYFIDLAELNQVERWRYCNIVQSIIDNSCKKYIQPYMGCPMTYHYQTSFGSDGSSGLIDFWLSKQIPLLPDMNFTIAHEFYSLKWEYSSGSDDSEYESEDEEDEYDNE